MSTKKNIKKILIILFFLTPLISLDAATNFLISPDLKLGDTNAFVGKLQKVLNTNGFVVNKALGQAGSLNNETNTFGLLTEKALASFQLKYNIVPAIGYFGTKSKTKLNELLNSGKFVEAASISSGKPISGPGQTVWGYPFGYVSRDAAVGFAEPSSNVGFTDQLLYNLIIDGYAGQPFGSCLQRSQFITNPTERAKCAAYENRDLAHVFAVASTPYKNVLIKNLTIKNAFRTQNAIGGVTSGGIPNDIQSGGDLPHTDTFQAYGQSNSAEWMVIQDTLIKNSDGGAMIVGDTKWNKGVVYQNLTTYCEPAFVSDTNARAVNDGRNYIGSSVGGTAPCGNQIAVQMWSEAPVWLINVSSGIGIFIDNPFRANNGPVIVVGSQVPVWTYDFSGGRWTNPGPRTDVKRYTTIEQALAAGNARPPYIELSCSGWGTPPAGCETRQGYLNEVGGSTSYYLSVSTSGDGTGTVTSSPAGINCGSDCSEPYSKTANTVVTLTAAASTGSTFTGWSGACTNTTGTCTVTMGTDRSVTANFSEPVLPFAPGNEVVTRQQVNVRRTPSLSGIIEGTQPFEQTGVIENESSVTADGVIWWKINYTSGVDGWAGQNTHKVTKVGTPGEFTLNTQTSGTGTGTLSGNKSTYNNQEIATVTATPSQGSTFTGWSGDCTGAGVCTITMNGNKSITANFTLNAVNTYSISTSVIGSGSIGGNNSPYNSDTNAILTTTPSEGFTFSGWSGDCTNTSGNCLLFMDRNKSVTATFTGISVQAPRINSITPDTKTITKGNTYTIAVNYSTPVERDIVLELKKGDPVIYTDKRVTVTPGTNKTISMEITVPQNVLVGEELNYLAFMAPVTGKWNSQVSFLQEYGIYASNGTSDDSDNDGVIDSLDKCPNTPANMKAHVNIHGCPKPVVANLKINSDVNTSDITNVSNFEIEDKNATFGKIKFNQPINVFGTTDKKSQINLDSYIQIQNKKVIVDSTNAPQFNKPATITLYNVNLTKPLIKKDGEVYATSSSPIMTYNPTTKILTFTVTGFSTYDIVEDISTYILSASKTGTGTGSIVGITASSTLYTENEVVTLTATADTGSTFTGWSGDCTGSGACTLTMNGNKTIAANFNTAAVVVPPPPSGGTTTPPPSGGTTSPSGSAPLGAYLNPNNIGLGVAPTVVTTPGYTFRSDLTLNSRHPDVIKLQQFLNNNGYPIASTGVGSKGQESNYFGPATRAALIRFQIAKKITPALGYFGNLTRTTLNSLGGTVTTALTTTPTPSVNTTGTYTFNNNLTLFARHSDVIKLQQFLNSKGYIIANTGSGSKGQESNYFGPATRAALIRFQIKNGITPASGFFGTLTRTMINSGRGI